LIQRPASKVRGIRTLAIAALIILAFGLVFLVSFLDQDREKISAHRTIESACEWPCTEEDRRTAGAWFATMNAEGTLKAQNSVLTETPVP